MKQPEHRFTISRTPWQEVFGTQIDSARHYQRHSHETFGVGLLVRGGQKSLSGRGQVEAYSGDVITTNPGEVHDGRPCAAARAWRMLYFEPQWLISFAGLEDSLELTQPVIADLRLRRSIQSLFARLDEWQRCAGEATTELASEESLARMLDGLLSRYGAKRRMAEASGVMRRARERLADESLRPPSLRELALMSGMSRYQVLRCFERTYGLPPHAWVLQQRAERARVLIRRGTSLVEAASALGFSDQAHMTRVFARHFGFTPGAWRQAAMQ